MLWVFAGAAWAADSAADAGRLSDQAFSFLNGISSGHDPGSNTLIGPVAGFAGDAQTLASALKRGDSGGAANAMASLQADKAAVDAALGAHPDPADASRWAALKSALDSLATQIKPAAAVPAGAPSDTASSSEPPSSSMPPPAAAVAESPGSPADGPQVTIESRSGFNGAMQIKGWLAGSNLKSAGIYSGTHKLENLHIDQIAGQQRVNFDLKLTGVQPGMVLRVYDHSGRSAEATLESPAQVASSGGVEVLRGDEPGPGEAEASVPPPDSGNTAEIPSAVPEDHPRFASGTLAGVQINLISVNQVNSMPRRYEVVGQISGGGVRRAGVYVDGRLVQSIPISSNAGAFSFDTTFQMLGGEATIRAYGVGDNFVETSVNLGSAGTPLYGNTPYVVNPYVYGANPYAYNPYGYGANPYPYGNPYAAPYGYRSPYGYPSPYGAYPPPNPPWWQRLLP